MSEETQAPTSTESKEVEETQAPAVTESEVKEAVDAAVKEETESTPADKKSKRGRINKPADAKKALDEVDAIKKAKEGTKWKDGAGRLYTKTKGSLVRDTDGKVLHERYHLLWSWSEV